MKPPLLGTLLLSLFVAPWSPATGAPDKPPFSGWLKVELVEDSVWWHCELTVSVDEHRNGSMSTGCRPGDSEVAQFRSTKQTLSADDVQVLRQLLREADMFGDQSWGYDRRGIDMGLSTLVVHDESKVAMLVCDQNKSFETGSRQRLLAWLHKRLSRAVPRARTSERPNNALNLTKRNCKRKNGSVISFAFRKLTRCSAGE